MSDWDSYIGRQRECIERVGRKDLITLAALLDYPLELPSGETVLPWTDQPMPPFAHWLNGNPVVPQSELGADGHQRKGNFLPDIPFPRRMWAGSKVQILGDFSAEQTLIHRETIRAIAAKSGRSGDMVFVTLEHEYLADETVVLREQQDRVYRAAIDAPVPMPESVAATSLLATQTFDWQRCIRPDPVLLFRYSGATANSHRIHYDRPYATGVENYPGLIVHGPLTATLLIDLFQVNNPGKRVTGFEFKGLRPLYDIAPFYLLGAGLEQGAHLWALDCSGQVAMEMTLCAEPAARAE